MELKKSPKADLNNKRGLMLEIGLILALLAVIGVFSYTPTEYRIDKVEQSFGPVEEEITEITRQDQKPPEPPKKTEITVITDILNVVTNDTKIATDFDFSEFDEDIEIVQQVAVAEENIEGNFSGGIFDNEIDHFIGCIREDKTPSANIEEAVQLQRMLMGIYESSKTGKEYVFEY